MHARAISFCLTTVLWAGHGEKDIRWTGKIIGTDSRGLFHCARLSRTQHHGRLCAHNAACRLNVRMHAREIGPTVSYGRAFPAVRLRRHSKIECHEKRISARRRLSTVVPDRVDRDARISNENFRTVPSPRRFVCLSSIDRWQSAMHLSREIRTMRFTTFRDSRSAVGAFRLS